jgi:hypothetical protein
LTVLRKNTESRGWFNPLPVGLTCCPEQSCSETHSVLHPESGIDREQ